MEEAGQKILDFLKLFGKSPILQGANHCCVHKLCIGSVQKRYGMYKYGWLQVSNFSEVHTCHRLSGSKVVNLQKQVGDSYFCFYLHSK